MPHNSSRLHVAFHMLLWSTLRVFKANQAYYNAQGVHKAAIESLQACNVLALSHGVHITQYN